MLKPGWMGRSQLCPRRTFLQVSAGWLGTQYLGLDSPSASAKDAKSTQSGHRLCSPFQRERSDGSLWLAERYAL